MLWLPVVSSLRHFQESVRTVDYAEVLLQCQKTSLVCEYDSSLPSVIVNKADQVNAFLKNVIDSTNSAKPGAASAQGTVDQQFKSFCSANLYQCDITAEKVTLKDMPAPAATTTSAPAAPAQNDLTWLWILLGILGAILLGILAYCIYKHCGGNTSQPPAPSGKQKTTLHKRKQGVRYDLNDEHSVIQTVVSTGTQRSIDVKSHKEYRQGYRVIEEVQLANGKKLRFSKGEELTE